MRARIRDGNLLLTAEDSLDAGALLRLYKRGHWHLVCTAFRARPRARYELILHPSVIRWQRPKTRKRRMT